MRIGDVLSLLLVTSGANRLYASFLDAETFPILAYQEVRGKVLESHLKALAPYYRFMSLEDALEYHRPKRSRPPLVLSFDQGTSSWLTEVSPVLRKRRIPAHFFVCPAYLKGGLLPHWELAETYLRRFPKRHLEVGEATFTGRMLGRGGAASEQLWRSLSSLSPADLSSLLERVREALPASDLLSLRNRYLTAESLSGLLTYDAVVGMQALDLPCLGALPQKAVMEKLAASKAELEALVQRPVTTFAYDSRAGTPLDVWVEAAKGAGFAHAVTGVSGWNKRLEDPFLLKRGRVLAGASLWRLRTTASGLLGQLEALEKRGLPDELPRRFFSL